MVALAAAGALASTGTAYLGARNLLIGQAAKARSVIPKSWDVPPRADGVYTPGGGPVQRWERGMPVDRAPDDLRRLDGNRVTAVAAPTKFPAC